MAWSHTDVLHRFGVQTLDAAVHWMVWILQQQAISMDNILSVGESCDEHATRRLARFLAELCTLDASHDSGLDASSHMQILKRLLYHSLQWLIQVLYQCRRRDCDDDVLIADASAAW